MKSEVYNIDCMIGMKAYADNYFDLAVVDPPYGIGDINQEASRKIYKKLKWNNSIPHEEYFIELKRASKNQIIWGINYYTKYISETGRLIHDKSNFGKTSIFKELSSADLASHSFGVNIKIFHYGWAGNVQNQLMNIKMEENLNKGIEKRIHPTQKPVKLYEWIFKNYAEEGQKILDTHLGSGSSRIAAYNYKMDFTGYEIDKDYFEAAEKRYKNHVKSNKYKDDIWDKGAIKNTQVKIFS